MYFENVETTIELKKQYRKMARLLHPDFNGDVVKFRMMVEEYDILSEKLLKSNTEFRASNDTKESMDIFKNIIDKLMKYNLDIEICGNWIWFDGDTKPIKNELKKLGCFWASKKLKWYWRPAEYKASRYKKNLRMTDLRNKYGSKVIPGTQKIAL